MPKCGSQCILCDVPIRIDTYKGCSHGCKYCFVYRKYDISKIKVDEKAQSVINFIKGKRDGATRWCDWNIPLHWGGMSDPFQPCERKYKNSLEVLKVFAESGYPFIVSTKNTLPTEDPYYSLFAKCNCVFQCSMCCPAMDKLEPGAPTFVERLEMMRKMSKIVPRTIARCQPYIADLHTQIMEQIPKIADAGVYGIIFEAIKMQNKTAGMIKNGADYIYPLEFLKKKFVELKNQCHKYGLVFLSGENRLRGMGDSLTCCGCEGLDGFRVSKYNLNYFVHNQEELEATPSMCKIGSSVCFRGIKQDSTSTSVCKNNSYKEIMDCVFRDEKK